MPAENTRMTSLVVTKLTLLASARSVRKTLIHRSIPVRRFLERLPRPVFGYESATPYRSARRIALCARRFASGMPTSNGPGLREGIQSG